MLHCRLQGLINSSLCTRCDKQQQQKQQRLGAYLSQQPSHRQPFYRNKHTQQENADVIR